MTPITVAVNMQLDETSYRMALTFCVFDLYEREGKQGAMSWDMLTSCALMRTTDSR